MCLKIDAVALQIMTLISDSKEDKTDVARLSALKIQYVAQSGEATAQPSRQRTNYIQRPRDFKIRYCMIITPGQSVTLYGAILRILTQLNCFHSHIS